MLSALAVATVLPSGENATAFTLLLWPDMVRRLLPVTASQIRTVLPLSPVATVPPSGENATAYTVPPSKTRVDMV